jgi:protein tyrosine/serine phosphatase
MKRLRDLGIRTIVDLEEPDPASIKSNSPADVKAKLQWLSLERDAAAKCGIIVIYHPLENKGENSLETSSDAEAKKRLDSVCEQIFARLEDGGVLFHCAAGHDRTGITAAYIRMKYQHWSVDEAIDEMRRLGHNWPKYSKNGGVSSWDEDHLRAIAGARLR